MLAALPIIAFILLFLITQARRANWRESFLVSALAWGVLITLSTEILSLFQWLDLPGVLTTWLAIDVSLAILLQRQLTSGKSPQLLPPIKSWQLSQFQVSLLAGVAVIVVLTGTIALLAPPNNFDSMTYHLGRVVHWIQNRSVDHYPTHIIRQLYPGPWSGYAIAQLQILSNGDHLANLVQWFSLVGSIIATSLIAKQLGANSRGQTFAAVFCATVPMGILQSSSTQNDLIAAFWLLCLSYFSLQIIQEKFGHFRGILVGLGLGLAILTKGTAYLYAFPVCLWLFFAAVKRLKVRLILPFLTMGIITLSLNISHFIRNIQIFGSFLGDSGQDLEAHGINIFLSNIIRNLALHLSTPVRSINLLIIRAVEILHVPLGISPDDPRITSPVGQSFDVHSLINHEDLAGNTLHLLIFLILTIWFFKKYSNFKSRQRFFLAAYWLTVISGFLLFCLLIIWSPWRSRLHLPIFIAAAPFMGVILSQLVPPRLAKATIAFVLIASSLWIFFNETRPLIANSQSIESKAIQNIFNQSRVEQYFISEQKYKSAYLDAAEFIESSQCSDIGLMLSGNTWEYPLWVLTNNHARPNLRIEHVGVENESALKVSAPDRANFSPCMIIANEVEAARTEQINLAGHIYQRTPEPESISIFMETDYISSGQSES
ncbi:uncharacterized protein XM38_022740 [Halomicronema hongdechloris C2206]|uniref:Glycosyltransferase RgtA/B/C/D-like domain-containing protein n=1 Tax=Halomicronema hongdechloris C2206 TaxID=1641165 RepID=A0A1Z3HLX6_9CYAN|nr:glycosyltransferase family 39 protein [Halomicronema hongdechloris]ASC71322.1 uncharacterized protein XM38_022740 [Halomicronema hongdechloris C2206]